MSSNYFLMWGMLAIMALGAMADPLVHGNLFGTIRAAYPSDATKRDALARCGAIESDFSRFSARDRAACYRMMGHAADLTVPVSDTE